ncbi:MAG TPA: hypothetical protein VJ783_16065 [Pirellulales bacterium]|nr:hypothetical protein [Pirellulales bacterium]
MHVVRQLVFATGAFALLISCVAAQDEPREGTLERDLIRVRVEEEGRPWLTINAHGHTAAVYALAFSPDSKRLYSAGLDKVVNVWNTSAAVRDLRRTRLLERSLRWPVNRGTRGVIYALAVAPNDGLLAMAGYGASNYAGEIWLVDTVQGNLVKVLGGDQQGQPLGHQQSVWSLAFSSDGQWLASLDLAGRAIIWRRGEWNPTIVAEDDAKTHPARAGLIAQRVQTRPLAVIGNTHVVLPVFHAVAQDGGLQWRLRRVALDDVTSADTFPAVHQGMVKALAASADGRRLASADSAGTLWLWNLAEPARPKQLAPGRVARSLAFSPDGRLLIVGSESDGDTSELQVWDVATARLQKSQTLADHVRACAVSPDGRQVAYTGEAEHAVFLGRPEPLPAEPALHGAARRVVKVAFARNEPPYRVGFGNSYQWAGFNQYGAVERSFDTQALALSAANAGEWLPVDWARGAWSARRENDAEPLQLYQGNQRQGYVLIADESIRCYCWLPGPDGQPAAVAVGTDGHNDIYVCRLAGNRDKGAYPILRRFRGHSDFLTSLGVSRDGRYLVSGSADGTVRFWSLSNYSAGRTSMGRWGAEFVERGEQLTVTKLDPAGPLFYKGVREGDVLRSIGWYDNEAGASRQERPSEIVTALSSVSWQTQVLFQFSRGGNDRAPFQLMPAWQPLAQLFVSDQDEWAFWTPEGYYDASANGHTLFGWQVNRGLLATPDFFRADQFQKNLEQPDVMERLLPTGSLNAALLQAQLQPPARPDLVVANQVEATPRITVMTPHMGDAVDKTSATVRALIEVPAGGELAQAKAFANGVVAAERRLVEEREAEGRKQLLYEWTAGLPAEQRVLIQVIAGTQANTVALGSVFVERGKIERAVRPPRLYLLAVGIDTYRDPKIQPLRYAVADAQSIVDLLRVKAPGLYDLAETKLQTNEQVTRQQWQASFAEMSQRLKDDAQPDDLFLIFMAGHGLVDAEERQYYFASYDLSAGDVLRGVYTGSISWRDFELLADVPCRKLAFLDTCHSGAIQPLRTRDLKAAIRALQEDVVLTVAASAGNERSEEKPAWQHGAFTKTLLEALDGGADASGDGAVSLDELITYVKSQVPKLTEGRQNPTAAPDELLSVVSLRLTGKGASAKPVFQGSKAGAR